MHHFKDNLQHLREFKDNAMGQCVSIAHNVGQPAQSGGFRNPVIDKDFPGEFECKTSLRGWCSCLLLEAAVGSFEFAQVRQTLCSLLFDS